MTIKLLLAVGVLQALTISEVRAGEKNCFDLPVASRPMYISQLFHDRRSMPDALKEKHLWSGKDHDGLDVVLPGGSELLAVAGGIVVVSGLDKEGTGRIVVQTPSGRRYLFGHVYAFNVKPGDQVKRGQIIGYSGGVLGVYGSGPHTNGAHLHFSILGRHGKFIDPLRAFCPEAVR